MLIFIITKFKSIDRILQFGYYKFQLIQIISGFKINQLTVNFKLLDHQMSLSKALEPHVSDFTKQQYTEYLESQLQKLSTFVVYQKKQNEKHNVLYQVIQEQNQKIKHLNDKVLLVELYQNQNLKNQDKLFQQTKKAISIEKRVNKLESLYGQEKLQIQSNTKYPSIDHIKHKIKNQLHYQMQDKLKMMREDLYEQMNKLQKHLLKQIRKIYNPQLSYSTQNRKFKQIKKREDKRNNESPIPTNYSENEYSRLRQIEKTKQLSKRHISKIQKRINSFLDQKLSKFQEQLGSRIQSQHPSPNNYSSIQQSQRYNDQQRSPISAYLKKQNDYISNKENIDTSNRQISSKSCFEGANKKVSQNKTKRTNKSRSKSKSVKSRSARSKSNCSFEKNNSFNKIVDKKYQKAINMSKLKSINTKKSENKQNSFHKKQNISNIKHINDNLMISNKLKDNHTCCTRNKQSKKSKKGQNKSKTISNHSQLSISQTSNRSRSKSQNNNQNEYLKLCNKLH